MTYFETCTDILCYILCFFRKPPKFGRPPKILEQAAALVRGVSWNIVPEVRVVMVIIFLEIRRVMENILLVVSGVRANILLEVGVQGGIISRMTGGSGVIFSCQGGKGEYCPVRGVRGNIILKVRGYGKYAPEVSVVRPNILLGVGWVRGNILLGQESQGEYYLLRVVKGNTVLLGGSGEILS